MEFMKNKKGFTLVELLAVIVILALIMGIAAYSMQGVTENVRISSMKSSALSIIDGVRNELLSNMNLDEGYYYVGASLLDKETESPWGGKYDFSGSTSARITEPAADVTPVCQYGSGSFVHITEVDSVNKRLGYSICLMEDKGHFIYANETILLKKDPDKSEYHYENATAGTKVEINTDGTIKP